MLETGKFLSISVLAADEKYEHTSYKWNLAADSKSML